MKMSDAESHSYFDKSVNVTEFNFSDDKSINDAYISIGGRYPQSGHAVNNVSTALVSIESGSGSIEIDGNKVRVLDVGDRLLIKPGEAYAFIASEKLVIRYIAAPAWTSEQSRIVKA